jgi:hypothetical protein
MRNPAKPAVGPLPSAPSPAASPREHGEESAGRPQPETLNTSRLAAFSATRDAARIGYGALAFWVVVAALVAARIAFLEPARIESRSSLSGTTLVLDRSHSADNQDVLRARLAGK